MLYQVRIYKIYSPNTNKIYIGSTKKKLKCRIKEHKNDYKRYLNNKYHYISSFEIVKYDDCKIELLEELKCDNKKEQLEKEKYYIQNNDCVNRCIPIRTKGEYYENNKEKIKEYQKEYNENNKEKIKEYRNEYYENNKEKIKEYREANKEKMKEYKKKYYENNKEKMKEYQKEYQKEYKKEYYENNKDKYKCELCNFNTFNKTNYTKHLKTKKHLRNTN